MVKVSVIVPVYNKEKYLPECLRSILRQSFKSLEVICINDGSTDRSLSILKHYAAADSRIKVISQKNAGAGAARNCGIDRSAGEYLLFMDADDYYPETDIVETLYRTAERENAAICGGSFSECHADGSIRTQWTWPLADYTFEQDGFCSYAEYQFDYGFHRFIYSAQLLKSSRIRYPDYAWYEDPPFMVQAMLKAGRFYAMRKITYCYRFAYQKQKWNAEKVNGLARGISDNMRTACENGLSKLLYLNYKRMTEEYADVIKSFMMPDNTQLILQLIQADRCIDAGLLMQEMPDCSRVIQKMPLYIFFAKEDDRCLTAESVKRMMQQLRRMAAAVYHSGIGIQMRILLRKSRRDR